MQIIKKKNKILYQYVKHKMSDNTKLSIICLIISFLFFIFAVSVSYFFNGNGPLVVGGIGICSILFTALSIFYILKDFYFYKFYYFENKLLLAINILVCIFWIQLS